MAVIQLLWSEVPGQRSGTLLKGQLWLNLADRRLYSHDGTTIFPIEANTAIGAVAPSNPDDGTLFFNTTTLDLMVWDDLNMMWQNTGAGTTAAAVAYDNTGSGLTATNVQNALDELAAENDAQDLAIAGNTSAINNNTATITSLITQVTNNDADILALQTQQAVNTGQIGTNTGNIGTNTTDIAALQATDATTDTRVTALEANDVTQDSELARLEAAKVDRAGDTMTGDLNMSNNNLVDTVIDQGTYP